MSAMTDFLEAATLNHSLGGTAHPFPGNAPRVALLTADPTDAGTQTAEVGRVDLTGGFGAAASRRASNAQQIAVDTTGWVDTDDLTHWAIVIEAAAGNYLWYSTLTNPIPFTAGQQLNIPVGGLVVGLDSVGSLNVTDVMANTWLDHALGTTIWSQPSSILVSLHTTNPGQGGGSEFTGGGYARQAFTLGTLDQPAAATRGRNSNAINFGNITSDPLDWWGIWGDAMFMYTRDQLQKAVPPGSNIDIPANRLEVLAA